MPQPQVLPTHRRHEGIQLIVDEPFGFPPNFATLP